MTEQEKKDWDNILRQEEELRQQLAKLSVEKELIARGILRRVLPSMKLRVLEARATSCQLKLSSREDEEMILSFIHGLVPNGWHSFYLEISDCLTFVLYDGEVFFEVRALPSSAQGSRLDSHTLDLDVNLDEWRKGLLAMSREKAREKLQAAQNEFDNADAALANFQPSSSSS